MVNCPISFDKILQNLFWPKSQQIFALMKTSFAFISRRRLQDVLIKTNIFALFIRLQKTSWWRTIYSSWSYVFKRFQDNFKTSSRQLQDIFKTTSRHVQDILLGHHQDVLQICLQDVFKTHHQVKLFLLTPLKDVFETYSRGFWDVLQRQLSTKGFA